MTNSDEIFWRLIEENRESLWRFALGLTRSMEDARDLVSDTVVAAHSSFSRLREHQAFRSFLFTIASRIHKRKVWRRKIFGTSAEAARATYEDHHESEHDLQVLLDALVTLPQKQQEALLLFEVSGLSLEEIRTIQGGSLSGVKQRLKRGREALRRLIVDEQLPAQASAGHRNYLSRNLQLQRP